MSATIWKLRRPAKGAAAALALLLVIGGCASEVKPDGVTYSAGPAVKTPKGSAVATMKASRELTDREKEDINKRVKDSYPNAVRVSGPSSYFNCHSYAWYSQSTSNKYWIDDPSKYWTDKSYRQVATTKVSNSIPSAAKVGHKVRYYSSQGKNTFEKNMHSAVVHSSSEVRSKWGAAGVYRHKLNETPYNPTNFYYYQKS